MTSRQFLFACLGLVWEVAAATQNAATRQGFMGMADLTTHRAHVQSDVSVSLSKGGKTLAVEMAIASKLHQFELSLSSIFTEDAEITVLTNKGVEKRAVRPSTFRSHEEGSRSAASVHADGSISGLFEVENHIVELRPEHGQLAFTPPSLLAIDARKAVPHRAWHYSYEELFGRTVNPSAEAPMQSNVSLADTAGVFDAADIEPEIEIDRPEDLSLDGEMGVQKIGVIKEPNQSAGAWNCTNCNKWFDLPERSCYPGDKQMHDLVLALLGDVPFTQTYKAGAQQHLEYIVNSATFVYEMQLNVRLVVKTLKLHETSVGALQYLQDCTNPRNDRLKFMGNKLQGMLKDPIAQTVAHLHTFTSCDNPRVGGVAWTNQACVHGGSARNTGVSMHYNWYAFAHELDHNLGGTHCTRTWSGVIKYGTPGSMMCDPSKAAPGQQFFDKKNRGAICYKLKKMLKSCAANFHVSTDTPTFPTTSAPTPAPTTAPTPAPTAGPTPAPTTAPTPAPTTAPTPAPTAAPTPAPTTAPTPAPNNGDAPSSRRRRRAARRRRRRRTPNNGDAPPGKRRRRRRRSKAAGLAQLDQEVRMQHQVAQLNAQTSGHPGI